MRVLLAALALCAMAPQAGKVRELEIEVRCTAPVHRMQGGIGASWHAISADPPLRRGSYEYTVPACCPRGSAYGGNPPLSNNAAWRQLEGHASWLGLDWVRVELSQRMCEPEKERFDWDNEEMQALYRILAWCDANGADVLLQQMWGNVEWNSFPGVHPIISAPRSLDHFAAGIAELLHHLLESNAFDA
jgi:hypothetical protein